MSFVIMDEMGYFIGYTGKQVSIYPDARKFEKAGAAAVVAKQLKKQFPTKFYDIVENYGMNNQDVVRSV